MTTTEARELVGRIVGSVQGWMTRMINESNDQQIANSIPGDSELNPVSAR